MTRRWVVFAALLVLTLSTGVGATATAGAGDTAGSNGVWADSTAAPTGTAGQFALRADGPERTRAVALGGSDVATDAATTDTLAATATLHRLPERPGTVRVELRYATPDRLESLEVELFDDPTLESTDGFTAGGDGTLAWDGRTDDPAATYTLDVNRTLDQTGPIAGPGSYTFVDTGEWALVQQPRLSHSWSWSGGGEVVLSRETAVAGPGAVGGRIAFLGEHETVTRDANGQRFRLVVPATAELAERPEDVFDSLSHASGALQVGDSDDAVFVVAAPTGEVGWGVRGLQTGDADMWVRDFERLDEADNVWLHEYVHTRQAYEAGEETKWFTEASATYYAASLALEQERIDFEQFRSRLAAGRTSRHADAVLSQPSTWAAGSNYDKGALASGELDRRLRLATDGGASLQEPFRRMNEHDGQIDQAAFLQMVADSGGEEPRSVARRYTETTDAPALWSADQHEAAFGTLPARIGYELPGVDRPDAIRVDGAYRRRSIGGTRPITLVSGERLSLVATVRNSGGTAGSYDAAFRVDGAVVDRRTGELAPDESRALTFERTFEEPGAHELSVGGDRLSVTVKEPAAARVTSVTLDANRIEPGESATLTATVTNDADYPGRATLTVRADGERRAERTVVLDADGERTVEIPLSFAESGTYSIAVEDGRGRAETSVSVADRSTVGGWSDGDLAVGALALAVVLALLAGSAYAFRRR